MDTKPTDYFEQIGRMKQKLTGINSGSAGSDRPVRMTSIGCRQRAGQQSNPVLAGMVLPVLDG